MRVIVLLLFLAACVRAAPEKQMIGGITYHVLRTPASAVRLVWKDKDGRQIRTFPEAAAHVTAAGETPLTIMNGGIFEPGGIPSGLLIQDGKEWRPVNRNQGRGNFFLQPNGIFLIGPDGAAVIRTDEYPVPKGGIRQAVQSGPLLLRNGKVHPQFNATSESRLHRNGVGVSRTGEVVFAMTDFRSPKYPNLHEFAELFRQLGCDDALFLDGDLSQMRSGKEILKPSSDFGSFIAVVGPAAKP
ncbi:phosphodiester glycosidase family protein [Luteolibacter marinus]|uniref:phosphodiester glycosidase family protein n=1 Tax=Luteolibacter marinus TaxID=2776705 RepID=UPI0018692F39|nr:phosphodiester glycosidase family protein [Luteolibacter marinus]